MLYRSSFVFRGEFVPIISATTALEVTALQDIDTALVLLNGSRAVQRFHGADVQFPPEIITSASAEPTPPAVTAYVLFEGPSGFNLNFQSDSTSTLKFSADGKTGWDYSVPPHDTKVYARGINSISIGYFRGTFTKISGNIHALFDYRQVEDGNIPETQPYRLTTRNNGGMFDYNHNLVDASDLVIPYTTLIPYGLTYLFQHSENLISAPTLPATTLASNCYRGMFQGCSGLLRAPEIMAEVAADSSCPYMFDGCSSLNYMACHFKTFEGYSSTYSWVSGVTSSGEFHAVEGVSYPSGIASSIPTNFTRINDLS